MSDKKTVMKNLLEKRLTEQGVKLTEIGGLALFRRDRPYKKRPQLYNPQIILLAQGRKNIYLGDSRYIYDPEHYYVQTVPLPVECEALVEEGKPILGMALRIDPQIIGEILFEMDHNPPPTRKVHPGLYDAPLTEGITDAAVRLLETLGSRNDRKILGPLYLKEIIYKILSGENGEVLRELAVNNRGFYQISRVINKIHEEYSRPLEIRELARETGMSSTAFHAAFKSMTSTSPLQYIKNVRLHKAKELLQNEGEKANAAALRVGYESSSQFSREYKRCFGVTPARDRQQVSAY